MSGTDKGLVRTFHVTLNALEEDVFCRSTSLIRFPESKCDVIRARCVIVLSQYSAYFLADEELIDLIEAAHKKDFRVPSEMIVDRWTLLAWFLRTEENN